jgi:hypothetical protein
MSDDKSQILWRCDPEIKQWLQTESDASGRSVTWLIEHAVNLWKKRLMRDRDARKKKAESIAG